MKPISSFLAVLLFLVLTSLSTQLPSAEEVNWKKSRTLKGMAFVHYVQSLNLKGQQALEFWKKIL